ncbi:Abi family protein [Tenacibaculum piscium]|uniref:Abi family protein n=1 Tax=Tenacibaculum piscium TaxID=1458515 RepID=UPI001F210376|nr:Abi family protein [Tenacibaculum piscium]
MKKPFTIEEHISLLKDERGLNFRCEEKAKETLKSISYYRLKGYWWDLQMNKEELKEIGKSENDRYFREGNYFEDIIESYNFDRELRVILFDAIEKIEIALRTKMINILSLTRNANWYEDSDIFESKVDKYDKEQRTYYKIVLDKLYSECNRSKEVFIKEHLRKHPDTPLESWKILETASFGTLSKLYSNLKQVLPEKSEISKGLGLNFSKELSGWLKTFTYIRNIIAHHSRLWGLNMSIIPVININNPKGDWMKVFYVKDIPRKKPFIAISALLYVYNAIDSENNMKKNILTLIDKYPKVQIHKLGFHKKWKSHDIWK